MTEVSIRQEKCSDYMAEDSCPKRVNWWISANGGTGRVLRKELYNALF